MKKEKRNIIIYLLTVALVLSTLFALVSCSFPIFGDGDGESDDESSNSKPVSELTESETETPVTEIEFIVSPEEPCDFRVLYSAKSVSNDFFFCDETAEETDLLRMRQARMADEYGVTLVGVPGDSEIASIKNGTNSGSEEYDVILADVVTEGIPLMLIGALQNLSAAGIDITPSSEGIVSGLTNELSFCNKTWMLFCDALSSDITCGACLEITPAFVAENAAIALELGEAALNNNLTLDFLCEIMRQIPLVDESDRKVTIEKGCESVLSLLKAQGAKIYSVSSDGVPYNLSDTLNFSQAYSKILSFCNGYKDPTNVSELKITFLKEIDEGSIFLPIPKHSDSTKQYATSVDLSSCSVLCVPAGIIGGRKVARLISILCSCSGDIRSKAKETFISKAGTAVDETAVYDLIYNSISPEPALYYTWGNLAELYGTGILNGTALTEITSDRNFQARVSVANASIAIIKDRLS